MTDTISEENRLILDMTGEIVSAYVSNNPVSANDLPSLITNTHTAINTLARGQESKGVDTEAPTPFTSIKKSVRPDRITCLHCGLGFKSIKRHLSSKHDQTPDEYKATFGLKSDYPMVCSEYSATRTQLAKNAGLGQKRRKGK